jgi:hypothetical protein
VVGVAANRAPAPVFSEGVRHFFADRRLRCFSTAANAAPSILVWMQSWASRITVTLALLTCLISPLVEMFDTWDHTIQMPAGFEAGSDDGVHAGFFSGVVAVPIATMRFARHSSKTSFGGIPKTKLNTGTFASSNTRA